jgi:Arc/MetJ-type ribon-helix-helix transcriptional regulator
MCFEASTGCRPFVRHARAQRRAGNAQLLCTLLDIADHSGYLFGMKLNTKSSITLPPEELELVVSLQARLKAKSKVEVVRRGLRLLQETTDRERLREAYRRASLATRESLAKELKELDPLVGDGLDER